MFFRVPICVVMSMMFGYIWLYLLSTSEALPSYYTFAVWAVALSCIIELSSLIVQLVASAFLFVRLKVRLIEKYLNQAVNIPLTVSLFRLYLTPL